jgi:hypothetical protein
MSSKLAIALVATLGLAGATTSAFAESSVAGDAFDHIEAQYEELYVRQLRDSGVDAVGLERWGRDVLAYIQNADGSVTTRVIAASQLPGFNADLL